MTKVVLITSVMKAGKCFIIIKALVFIIYACAVDLCRRLINKKNSNGSILITLYTDSQLNNRNRE